MFENVISKVFKSIVVLSKYFGVASVGAAIACFFMYGIQSFTLGYFGGSILLVILSIVANHIISYNSDYDYEEVNDYENV